MMKKRAFAVLLALAAATAAASDDRVEKLTPEHRKWLEEEVVYIITDKEKDAFLTLESIEERDRLIEAFWDRRDPDHTTPENEFKEEHYARWDYANETFNRQTSRPGWQTDQGRIFITLGPPQEREKFEAHYNLAYCELWTYQAPPNTILPPFFHLLFFKQHDVGEYELYSPLADGPLRLVRGTDRFTVDPMVAMRELLDISPNLAHAALSYDLSESPDFRTGRATLGSEIIVARIADAPTRNVRTDYVDAWLRHGKKVSTEYSFNFIPSRSAIAVLAGPQGVPFVHYRIEVDPENFKLVGAEDESRYYTTLDLTLEVTTPGGVAVVSRDKEVYIELTPDEIQEFNVAPFAYQDDLPLVPGEYTVSVVMRNRAASQYTVAEHDVQIPPTSSEPAIGNIVLGYEALLANDDAADDEMRTFQIGKERVQPAPEATFFIGETAYAFFQVLHAAPDQDLRFALASEDGAIVVAERTASLSSYRAGVVNEDFLLVDIDGGRYQLRVELVDASGAVLATQATTLNVSPRNPLPRAWVHTRSFDARVPGALALAVGSQFQVLGKQEEAARALGVAIVADPDKAEARWRLAGIHLGWREPDEALALLLPLERDHADQYEVAAGLGFAFYMKSDLAAAVPYFEKAIAIRPPSPGLLNTFADCHDQLGNREQAKKLWERSLELDPSQEPIRDKLEATGDD